MMLSCDPAVGKSVATCSTHYPTADSRAQILSTGLVEKAFTQRTMMHALTIPILVLHSRILHAVPNMNFLLYLQESAVT